MSFLLLSCGYLLDKRTLEEKLVAIEGAENGDETEISITSLCSCGFL